MVSRKVLVLVHSDCVPPESATVQSADWAHWKTEYYVKKTLQKLGHQVVIFPVSEQLNELQRTIVAESPDLVFNLLEEFRGEPRYVPHVVSVLELMGVPYTGCNPLGLELGSDKAISKKIVQSHGVHTPDFFTVLIGKSTPWVADESFPLIVKSLNEEASLGISQQSVVHSQKELESRVQFIHQNLQTPALVEQYIEGREFYVGVLGHKKLTVFHPWELVFGRLTEKGYPIATRNVKFSKEYGAKKQIKRQAARGLSPHVLRRVTKTSREIYRALKLSGYARLDFRLTSGGQLFFLEANPNPELAKGECFANAARYSGWSYEQVIAKIIRLSSSSGQIAA